MTPDEIIQKLESSWAHEQNGSLWKKWVPSNPVNAQKLRAYWSGPLDAAPPLVTSEYGLARLDQMVAHHGLKRGVQLSEIIIGKPPSPITTSYTAKAGFHPFSADGPWRSPIPASPAVHASSATWVAKLVGWGNPVDMPVGTAGSASNDWNFPTYYASTTDPLYTIALHVGGYGGWEALQGTQIRIPNQARGASAADSQCAVVDVHTGWVHCFYHFQIDATHHAAPNGGGTIEASAGAKFRIGNSGWLLSDSESVGIATDGSGGSSGAGSIRIEEMQAGVIDHALRMVVKSTNGSWAAPANYGAGSTDATNAPPSGARFQLNMTFAEIDALNCSSHNKILYKALSKYGAYVTDTGTSTWNFQPASTVPWIVAGQSDPWVSYAVAQSMYDAGGGVYYWQVHDPTERPNWATKLRVIA